MATKPIVIIGAGLGGLSTAIRLALAGRRVVIFEKNEAVGGKMGQMKAAGYRWDTGPSVITMRHVLADLFAEAGRCLEDYLTLQPVNPLTRYFYPDGTVLDASRDLPEMLRQIAALDERDVEGYLAYLAYAARLHRITGPVFIYDEPPTWRSLNRVSLPDILRVDGWRTMDKAIRSFVSSPHLRQLLGRFATYVGGSPYRAPATLNVIGHVELAEGVWYPQGGIYKIAESLARLAAELGVEIHTSCGVQHIATGSGRVEGVVLEDGYLQAAETVVANVDVTTVYKTLLLDRVQTYKQATRLARLEPSASGFIMLLGVRGIRSQLAHHNIFFSEDYRREFEEIFKQGRPPVDPTIYVAITARSDPDHAPPGCENWFVLVNAPALADDYDWTTQAPCYRQLILERLAGFGLDIRDQIEVEKTFTPADLARLTGAWGGALYGPSANSPFTAFRRPHNRARDIKGLYFVGGTTHPGGGVPLVLLSGRVTAGMVLQDLK